MPQHTIPAPPKTSAPKNPAVVASLNVDVTRCGHKNDKDRRCILSADHKLYAAGSRAGSPFTEAVDGHLFKTGGEHRPVKPLTGKLVFEDVPDKDRVAASRETVRSDLQKQMDERVDMAHKKWIAAGKPESFADCPQQRIMFEPGNADTVRLLLESSGRFLNVSVRIIGPKSHTTGNQFFVYTAKDVIKRSKKG